LKKKKRNLLSFLQVQVQQLFYPYMSSFSLHLIIWAIFYYLLFILLNFAHIVYFYLNRIVIITLDLNGRASWSDFGIFNGVNDLTFLSMGYNFFYY